MKRALHTLYEGQREQSGKAASGLFMEDSSDSSVCRALCGRMDGRAQLRRPSPLRDSRTKRTLSWRGWCLTTSEDYKLLDSRAVINLLSARKAGSGTGTGF